MFTYDSFGSSTSEQEKRRKLYQKPKLEVLGDLRSLTLGGSPGGPDDSGVANYYYPGQPHLPQPEYFPPPPPGKYPPGMFVN